MLPVITLTIGAFAIGVMVAITIFYDIYGICNKHVVTKVIFWMLLLVFLVALIGNSEAKEQKEEVEKKLTVKQLLDHRPIVIEFGETKVKQDGVVVEIEYSDDRK